MYPVYNQKALQYPESQNTSLGGNTFLYESIGGSKKTRKNRKKCNRKKCTNRKKCNRKKCTNRSMKH